MGGGACQKRSREEGEWMVGADPGHVNLDQSVSFRNFFYFYRYTSGPVPKICAH